MSVKPRKFQPTPRQALEIWAWREGVGPFSKAMPTLYLSGGEAGVDQSQVIAIWVERFMVKQAYKRLVLCTICDRPYSWREPGETKFRALMRHGLLALLDKPTRDIPDLAVEIARLQLTEWAESNPAPEFSQNFEIA